MATDGLWDVMDGGEVSEEFNLVERKKRKKDRRSIFTIGFGRGTPDGFVRRLKSNGITKIIDVRGCPDKTGRDCFNCAGARRLCEGAGIEYENEKKLGNKPTRIGENLKNGGEEILEDLAMEIDAGDGDGEKRICVMCACGNYERCHRREVAGRIIGKCEKGVIARHIGRDGEITKEVLSLRELIPIGGEERKTPLEKHEEILSLGELIKNEKGIGGEERKTPLEKHEEILSLGELIKKGNEGHNYRETSSLGELIKTQMKTEQIFKINGRIETIEPKKEGEWRKEGGEGETTAGEEENENRVEWEESRETSSQEEEIEEIEEDRSGGKREESRETLSQEEVNEEIVNRFLESIEGEKERRNENHAREPGLAEERKKEHGKIEREEIEIKKQLLGNSSRQNKTPKVANQGGKSKIAMGEPREERKGKGVWEERKIAQEARAIKDEEEEVARAILASLTEEEEVAIEIISDEIEGLHRKRIL